MLMVSGHRKVHRRTAGRSTLRRVGLLAAGWVVWMTAGLFCLQGADQPRTAGTAGPNGTGDGAGAPPAAAQGASGANGDKSIEANANQILIAYEGAVGSQATRDRNEARTLAMQLAQLLAKDPSQFPALVARYSDGSKVADGAVGPFRHGRMTPAFEVAAFALPVGGITPRPVESPYGFHIIQRTPVPAVYFGRCLLLAFDGVAEPAPVHPPRSKKEAAELAATLYSQLRAHPDQFRELQMQYSDDPNKPLGGYLPDFYPGRAEESLVKAVAEVKVGEVAAPLETRYGYVLVQRLEPLRNRPPLRGFASATHLMIGYAGAAESNATRNWIEAREQARRLAAEARKDPSRFLDLVRQYSEAPDPVNGGDLGFVDLEHLAPHMYDFGQALQQLAVGEVSDPVESGGGFHVLLRKPLPTRLRARQIIVGWTGSVQKVERDKASAAIQAAKYLADLKQVAPADLEAAFVKAVDKYSDVQGDRGGDLGTFAPQDYFPAVTEALLKTPVGGLTDLVDTPYGYAILLRLEPQEKLPEEAHPVKLPDLPREGRGPERPDRSGPAPQ